jgi:sterol 3beta-glucosyltransferase
MKKYARLMVDEMYDACEGSELIIYHPGCTVGYFAAEKMGVPSVLASPFPMLQTNKVASVISYGKSKMSKKQSYKMIQSMLWMASKTGVMSFWKEKFGKLPENFGCPFERVDESHPSIVSCSNYVFPRPLDWNKNIHQFGYWFIEESKDFTPPKELTEFLENGEKPIYFGFGSVFNVKDKDVFVTTVTEALHKTGRRGIISGMGRIDNLPNVITIDSVPHTWLFPRCAAVCHHGGAGTSAAGFSAGVPSIIIPFSNDQFAWAHRSYDIGVGAKPIYKKQLSIDRLVEAIGYVLSDKVVANAKKLGEDISSENGARDCAAAICEIMIS